MPKGRPRKTGAVLKLTGRARTNPDRMKGRRALEPIAQQHITDEPPKWMGDKGQRACYREIVRGCLPDVLSSADRVWIEITACLLNEFRSDPAGMGPAKVTRLTACLSQLGMSPADRTKAARMPREKENEFKKLFAA